MVRGGAVAAAFGAGLRARRAGVGVAETDDVLHRPEHVSRRRVPRAPADECHRHEPEPRVGRHRGLQGADARALAGGVLHAAAHGPRRVRRVCGRARRRDAAVQLHLGHGGCEELGPALAGAARLVHKLLCARQL
eukprot:1378624-Rhodomonas_salina.1